MPKKDLGTKRTCPETGKNFYDLNKDPIVSPYTGKEYPISFFEEVTPTPDKAPRGSSKPEDPEDDEDDEDEDDVVEDVAKKSDDDDDDEEEDDTPEIDEVDKDAPIPTSGDDSRYR